MRTFDCPSCGWSGHPGFELNSKGKIAATCQGKDCQYSDPGLGPADFTMTASVENGLPVMIESDRVAAKPNAPKTVAPQILFKDTKQKAEPMDVLGPIKARRDWLEGEIARLEGYRVEKRKLDKMLAAAKRVDAETPTPKTEAN